MICFHQTKQVDKRPLKPRLKVSSAKAFIPEKDIHSRVVVSSFFSVGPWRKYGYDRLFSCWGQCCEWWSWRTTGQRFRSWRCHPVQESWRPWGRVDLSIRGGGKMGKHRQKWRHDGEWETDAQNACDWAEGDGNLFATRSCLKLLCWWLLSTRIRLQQKTTNYLWYSLPPLSCPWVPLRGNLQKTI